VNVIQRPDRQTSLEASLELRQAGLEPAWHLVTRGRSRDEIQGDLVAAQAGGIRQVLCILGDHPAAGADNSPTIKEAVAMTRELVPGALVGATLNQYGKDSEATLRNLVPKLRAGAGYIQTQPVFDPASVEPYALAIDREAPGTRIIAMAMPLLSIEAGERIEERIGIRLPDALREVLASGDEQAAWAAFDSTIQSLVRTPYIDGVAVMTFQMDAPPEMGERIVRSLREAGIKPD